MKKRALLLCLLALCMLLSACRQSVTFTYMADRLEIIGVSLVSFTVNEADTVIWQETIVISDIAGFIADFEALPCHNWLGDPAGLYGEGVAIKLTYLSGEYQLITANGGAEYRKDANGYFRFLNYTAYRTFDEAEFAALLDAYKAKLSPSETVTLPA